MKGLKGLPCLEILPPSSEIPHLQAGGEEKSLTRRGTFQVGEISGGGSLISIFGAAKSCTKIPLRRGGVTPGDTWREEGKLPAAKLFYY